MLSGGRRISETRYKKHKPYEIENQILQNLNFFVVVVKRHQVHWDLNLKEEEKSICLMRYINKVLKKKKADSPIRTKEEPITTLIFFFKDPY